MTCRWLGGGNTSAFALKSRRKKLKVYFIDNEHYFGNRWTVYGDFDDGERLPISAKAALASMAFIGLQARISSTATTGRAPWAWSTAARL